MADGRTQGFVAPGFERVRDAFDAGLAEEMGAGFAVVRDGQVIVELWGGWANREQTRPWARDTIVPVYSTTKGVSALVMAKLFDDGLLDYEAPTAALWPAFGARGKDKVTIAQTLAHQAGVPGFLEPIDPDLWLDPPSCAAAIAALAPLWPPGSASGYHPLTWGYIVGELAQRAAGRSLGTILREDICTPLGIDFQIGTPESEHARASEMKKPTRGGEFGEITPPRKAAFFTKWAAPVRGSTQWRKIEIPSANGHATALGVARLFEAFATGGMIGGSRIVSQEAFDALTRRRFVGDDLVLPFNVDWRTGVLGNSNRFYGPNPEAIGHSGAGGSCGFGDPIAGVSVGYVMNKQSHHIMGDPRSLALIEALYACL
ncbi:serine hydrolase domain-containing protein [Terricaulis sp.]|uniref:serine hydrolase domain-containing protein n=1 Tax=Terricaulis sp. TaxID=2768686 RepID=UPI003783349A